MKTTFCFILLCCFVISIKAQYGPTGIYGPSYGISQAQQYQNYVIQIAASKLATSTLPVDLQIQLGEVLANAEISLAACDELLSTPAVLVWQYKRCAAFQLKNTILQLAIIEREATLRNSTTTEATAEISNT